MGGKRYVRVVLLAAGLLPGCGDVVFESDPCKYMVGSHTVHFEAFQGSVWARNPCDEIPSIGSASLSIDLLDKELRAMQTGVRIFSADSWSAARNSKNDAQGKELVQWPAKTYPTGVISLTHDFRAARILRWRRHARRHEERREARAAASLPRRESSGNQLASDIAGRGCIGGGRLLLLHSVSKETRRRARLGQRINCRVLRGYVESTSRRAR